jgi:hypothetical protein
MRRTPVQVWTHPEVLCQDVSILAEQGRIVSTLCPGWSTLHEPCTVGMGACGKASQ